MSRLPALKSADIMRVLNKVGFIEHRQKGSHKIFKKGELRITLPIHNKELKRGTLHSIIEQTGLTAEEFFNFLKD